MEGNRVNSILLFSFLTVVVCNSMKAMDDQQRCLSEELTRLRTYDEAKTNKSNALQQKCRDFKPQPSTLGKEHSSFKKDYSALEIKLATCKPKEADD